MSNTIWCQYESRTGGDGRPLIEKPTSRCCFNVHTDRIFEYTAGFTSLQFLSAAARRLDQQQFHARKYSFARRVEPVVKSIFAAHRGGRQAVRRVHTEPDL